jgi:hypothetical protein
MTGEPVLERATTALPDSARPAPLAAAGSPSGPRPMRRTRRPAIVACLAALGLLCLPAPVAGALGSSAGDARGGAPAADDPVVGQVLQMLRGGVTEPVIMAWLEKSGKRPAAVSSGDLVALHQAGASEQLMKWLLQPAGGPAPAPDVAAPPAASAPPAANAAPPAAGAVPPAATPLAAGPVKVRFAVTYRPTFADPEQPVSERWLLCLYVDGRFVACVPAGPVLVPLPPRTFERDLAPGKHLLRLTQERHLRYSRARGYVTPARVDPSVLAFELPPGAATQIAIHFGERSLRHPGPVAVRIERDGKEVARLEPAAPDPDAWPALCEDVPAALPAGAKPPAPARRDLASCVHWPALWPGVEAVPAREEVRAEIARQGLQPGAAAE